eukprot:scaffold2853_cov123-Isochrysis_galbana.AAC.4
MIFRKYPTYRLPSAYRWYSVPTKRPEAKQAHAPEIFAIPAEDLREDKKSSQYLPSWDFRLLSVRIDVMAARDRAIMLKSIEDGFDLLQRLCATLQLRVKPAQRLRTDTTMRARLSR